MGNSLTRMRKAFVEFRLKHVKYKEILRLLHSNGRDMRECLTKAEILHFYPIFKHQHGEKY